MLLREIALSPSQSSVYLELLSGNLSVKELEIRTKFGRSTIVEALLFLEELELIDSSFSGKKKIYTNKGIGKLNQLVDEKISNLAVEQEKLGESKVKIGKFFKLIGRNLSTYDTSTQIFIGKKQIANLYRSTLAVNELYSICRLDDYYEIFPGGMSLQSLANSLNKTRRFRDLVIDGPAISKLIENQDKANYKNYEIKIIKDSSTLRESSFSDIVIADTFTIFSNFRAEIPYSIKLNSLEISMFLKYFHTVIWESLS